MDWWVSNILSWPNGYVILFSWCFWVILSICLHELGHGITAIWEGDDTPIHTGHMTLNPVVHMGHMSLLMFAIIGIAWGAMPVNPYNFRHGRRGDILVAFGGPAVNLILAFLALTILAFVQSYAAPTPPTQSSFIDNVSTFLYYGGMLNIALFIFNLLPVPPFDGSRILAGLSPQADEFFGRPEVQQASLIALVVLVFFGGKYLWPAASDTADAYLRLLYTILP
jgi:Zn-dependent protease